MNKTLFLMLSIIGLFGAQQLLAEDYCNMTQCCEHETDKIYCPYTTSTEVCTGGCQCCNGAVYKDNDGKNKCCNSDTHVLDESVDGLSSGEAYCCEKDTPNAFWRGGQYACCKGTYATHNVPNGDMGAPSGCCPENTTAKTAEKTGASYCCKNGWQAFGTTDSSRKSYGNSSYGCCPIKEKVNDVEYNYTVLEDGRCCTAGIKGGPCCQIDNPVLLLQLGSTDNSHVCCPAGTETAATHNVPRSDMGAPSGCCPEGTTAQKAKGYNESYCCKEGSQVFRGTYDQRSYDGFNAGCCPSTHKVTEDGTRCCRTIENGQCLQ